MVDTMCENDECPLRHRCYRFQAEPDDYCQSYSSFAIGVDGKCEDFIRLRKKAKPQASTGREAHAAF